MNTKLSVCGSVCGSPFQILKPRRIISTIYKPLDFHAAEVHAKAVTFNFFITVTKTRRKYKLAKESD